MAIKDTNYITIQGWMINELGLKGNELIIYAVIYGFSQDGEQKFTGSLQYLADVTLSTKQGVLKNLKSLCEKCLLGREEKIINGVKFVEYYATKFNGVLNKVEQGMQQSLTGGIKQSLTNNTSIYNTNNNLSIKESSEEETSPPTHEDGEETSPPTHEDGEETSPPTHEDGEETSSTAPKENKKTKHGEYGHVLLTDNELKKLNDEYGKADDLIRILDEYIEMSGKKYKSHYLAIKKWVVDALKEKNSGAKPKQDNKVPDNKPIDPLEARLQARLHEKIGAENTPTSEAISQKMAELGIGGR